MFLAGTHTPCRHSWRSLGCRHSESCWMDAIEPLPLHWLLLQHRCQVTLSLGRRRCAGQAGPLRSRALLNAAGKHRRSALFYSSLWLQGWLAGIIPKADTVPESTEALYIIQQSPPEVAIIATYSLIFRPAHEYYIESKLKCPQRPDKPHEWKKQGIKE